MATNVYTSTYTLDAVRRRGLLATTGRVTDSDLIGFVNDATQDYVVPLLMASREGFLYATAHTAFTGDGDYAMPVRAAGERLVRIALVTATDIAADEEYPLTRIETSRRQAGQEGFELADNLITIRESPAGYSYLRIVYFQMPNRLVALDECAKVASVGATTVTIDAQPTTAFTTAEPLDFIAGTPGFRWRAIDKTPTLVAGTTLTFTVGDIPSTMAIGDYVALAGETPIVQVPATLRPLVEQRTVCLALEALGDGRLGTAQKTLLDMEKRLVPTLSPRVPGAPRVIVPPMTGRTLPIPFR